jgi:RimJ/RimL family protein N-acetyltransferase
VLAAPNPPLSDGVVSLRPPEERDLSVGYWLLADVRGRGLAARAVRLVSRWALRDLALARVALLTETSNGPSQRVAERTGFQREGVLRSYGEIDGRRVDFISFSLLPRDVEQEG